MPASRAGDRNPRYRTGWGRVDNNRIMWLTTQTTGLLSVNLKDHEEFDENNNVSISSETGPTYQLLIQVPGRTRPVFWDLSSMTHEELDAARKFFNHLFNLAEPVVRERDRVAADALAEGDDSFTRVYRSVPQFIVRERAQLADGEGVLDGHEGPAE